MKGIKPNSLNQNEIFVCFLVGEILFFSFLEFKCFYFIIEMFGRIQDQLNSFIFIFYYFSLKISFFVYSIKFWMIYMNV